MKAYTIDLKEEYSFLQGGTLECWIGDYPYDGELDPNWKRPALIVVPGGGYGMCSKREAEPVATAFYAKGFQVFILTYLCRPDGVRYPEQLLEAAAAVDYVKTHAKACYVNPEEVFLVGFSAGGHLVGNLAVEHQNVEEKSGVALRCKPTAVGLCYPVISCENGHLGSYENLLCGYSEEEKEAFYKWVSLEKAVSEHTPPAFIWATAEDDAVPADNALRYALALARKGISYEIHVYPRGWHGFSTANREINRSHADLERVSRWVDDCAAYFRLFTEEIF